MTLTIATVLSTGKRYIVRRGSPGTTGAVRTYGELSFFDGKSGPDGSIVGRLRREHTEGKTFPVGSVRLEKVPATARLVLDLYNQAQGAQ